MAHRNEDVFGQADDILKEKIVQSCVFQYIRGLTAAVLCVSLSVWILFGLIFELEIVDGDSMTPTLENGTMALAYRLETAFSYGDVVLLRGLGEDDYIKRVIGLPGDTIDIDGANGRIVRNGIPLDEPYTVGPTLPREDGVDYPVVLAEGEYFLLGDNRVVSYDSRIWGAVPKEKIKAKVIFPIL